MLVLSQKSWSTISYDEVNAEICSLAATWRRRNPLGLAGPLVLLPLAEQIPCRQSYLIFNLRLAQSPRSQPVTLLVLREYKVKAGSVIT